MGAILPTAVGWDFEYVCVCMCLNQTEGTETNKTKEKVCVGVWQPLTCVHSDDSVASG